MRVSVCIYRYVNVHIFVHTVSMYNYSNVLMFMPDGI